MALPMFAVFGILRWAANCLCLLGLVGRHVEVAQVLAPEQLLGTCPGPGLKMMHSFRIGLFRIAGLKFIFAMCRDATFACGSGPDGRIINTG